MNQTNHRQCKNSWILPIFEWISVTVITLSAKNQFSFLHTRFVGRCYRSHYDAWKSLTVTHYELFITLRCTEGESQQCFASYRSTLCMFVQSDKLGLVDVLCSVQKQQAHIWNSTQKYPLVWDNIEISVTIEPFHHFVAAFCRGIANNRFIEGIWLRAVDYS